MKINFLSGVLHRKHGPIRAGVTQLVDGPLQTAAHLGIPPPAIVHARDELTACHFIVSSATAMSEGGTSRPSIPAVCRLITSSNYGVIYAGVAATELLIAG
jgi:hypothetical protein